MKIADSTDAENSSFSSSQLLRIISNGSEHKAKIYAGNKGGSLELLRQKLADGLDHPELWETWPQFLAEFPDVEELAKEGLANILPDDPMDIPLRIANALCLAHRGEIATAIASLEVLRTRIPQTALIQGAMFYVHGMADPSNPIYQLKGRICRIPFHRFAVNENASFFCCSGWLPTSVGDCFNQPWEEVWNSPKAQAIRESIHDGSYRFCKKMQCPWIQSGEVSTAEALAAESEDWKDIVTTQKTKIETGPEIVGLSYDRSCNLRCPSCRTSAYTADKDTRDRFDELQEKSILPLLRSAKMVSLSGSGDPFASRSFRRLIMRLGPEEYPHLRFHIQTNGMLLTRKEWEKFPNLHGRVEILRVSIDAAKGETHEKLRLGAKWSVMLENMEFFGELKQKGLVKNFWLAFVVQQGNYKEMGDAAELAERLGAQIWFARIANFGTFTKEEYLQRAVFLKSHPEYAQFLEVMKDPRLLGHHVGLGIVPIMRSIVASQGSNEDERTLQMTLE